MKHPRALSLLSSGTEMVCALGLGECLVGRSHECDYPAEIVGLPVCTEPRFSVDGTSLEIDERVKSLLAQALSPYHVRPEALRDLQPDVIITQTQCEVCAVSLSDVHAALQKDLGINPEVVNLQAESLSGIWDDIQLVATALGVESAGDELVKQLQSRMEAVERTAANLGSRPTVCCVEWIEPLMAAGNWVPELVAMAGGENTHGEAGKHSPYFTWNELVDSDPDVIAVFPCGYDIAQTEANMHFLTERPEWAELRAVRTERVYLADGSQYFNRPGPRIADSLEILAEIVHPEQFSFGYSDAFKSVG